MKPLFSHLPAWVDALACGIWRASDIINEIVCSAVVTEFPNGVFIKLTDKSPKTADGGMRPCRTVSEVLDLLTGDANLLDYLKRPEFLVVKPWRTPTVEYRLFLTRGQLRAISTGNCYRDHPDLSPGQADGLLNKHLTKIEAWWSEARATFPFREACLDWDGEHGLIEINPCGDWGPAGSALFHWIDDAEMFDRTDDVVTVRAV